MMAGWLFMIKQVVVAVKREILALRGGGPLLPWLFSSFRAVCYAVLDRATLLAASAFYVDSSGVAWAVRCQVTALLADEARRKR
jgi:hypothetical protein